MSIYMLSDTANLNSILRSELCSDIKQAGGRIAYISSSEPPVSIPFFENTRREYKAMCPDFAVDYFDITNVDELQNYGVWHFSGGNSFEFMDRIKKSGLDEYVRPRIGLQPVIIGVSAGSIVLSPNLKTSLLLNEHGRAGQSVQAIGAVPFEFYPHYMDDAKENSRIAQYAEQASALVVACPDTDGIRIDDGRWKSIGKITVFDGRLS